MGSSSGVRRNKLNKSFKKGFRHCYKKVRAEYKVNAYTGAKVLLGKRPCTIMQAAGDTHVVVQLEDRIDKTWIRINASRLTFLEPYVPNEQPRTKRAREVKRKREQALPTDFETKWL